MAIGDVHEGLPERQRGAVSTIRPLLLRYSGKWVELKHGVSSGAAPSYHRAKWVDEEEAKGRKVEFAVRNGVLYGRITLAQEELWTSG